MKELVVRKKTCWKGGKRGDEKTFFFGDPGSRFFFILFLFFLFLSLAVDGLVRW